MERNSITTEGTAELGVGRDRAVIGAIKESEGFSRGFSISDTTPESIQSHRMVDRVDHGYSGKLRTSGPPKRQQQAMDGQIIYIYRRMAGEIWFVSLGSLD